MRDTACLLATVLLTLSPGRGYVAAAPSPRDPNIIIILADDLGYGDVGAFNPEGRIPTPNIDRLSRERRPGSTSSAIPLDAMPM
jgi:hypothetical protein